MECTGLGPTRWRTSSFSIIAHPLHCMTQIALVKMLKKRLYGRLRRRLRLEISLHAARLETLWAEGRMGEIIQSVLQEDVELFTLEALPVPDGGILTDHRLIHNGITKHFRTWYQGPPGLPPDWPSLLQDHTTFGHTHVGKRTPAHSAQTSL